MLGGQSSTLEGLRADDLRNERRSKSLLPAVARAAVTDGHDPEAIQDATRTIATFFELSLVANYRPWARLKRNTPFLFGEDPYYFPRDATLSTGSVDVPRVAFDESADLCQLPGRAIVYTDGRSRRVPPCDRPVSSPTELYTNAQARLSSKTNVARIPDEPVYLLSSMIGTTM